MKKLLQKIETKLLKKDWKTTEEFVFSILHQDIQQDQIPEELIPEFHELQKIKKSNRGGIIGIKIPLYNLSDEVIGSKLEIVDIGEPCSVYAVPGKLYIVELDIYKYQPKIVVSEWTTEGKMRKDYIIPLSDPEWSDKKKNNVKRHFLGLIKALGSD